jgi:2-iminobutanoate/2-iminopropanoate deaminase
MKRKVVIANDAPFGAGPYSPAVRAGDFLYLSGIGALDPITHDIIGKDVAAQTRQTMNNIGAILKAGGASLDHIVKMGVYLQNPDDYEDFNIVYSEYFSQPYPARLTVGAGQVWDMLIKMDCIAYLGAD